METTAADELMAKITTRKLETTNKSLIEDIESKHIHTIIRNIHYSGLGFMNAYYAYIISYGSRLKKRESQ